MADLSVTLASVRLANPLILASGPLSYDADAILRAWDAGAAAAVTKTITLSPSVNPAPHIASAGVRGSLINSEKSSDLAAERWIETEIPKLRSAGGGIIIASVIARPADVEALARPLASAGAHMLEVVGHYLGGDMGEPIRLAKQCSGLPVLAKLSANWPDVLEAAQACLEAGADGITTTDSLGPALAIDIESARPKLEGPWGFGWVSGAAIKPIALRVVAQIALRWPVPIAGVGGVSSAEDAIEMMMAGASAVGVHTAAHLNGLGWFSQTLGRLEAWLDAHGHRSVAEVQRVALPWLRDGERNDPLEFNLDATKCSACGRCVTVCSYQARTMVDGLPSLDLALCRSCGLCASVCPTRALTISVPGPVAGSVGT